METKAKLWSRKLRIFVEFCDEREFLSRLKLPEQNKKCFIGLFRESCHLEQRLFSNVRFFSVLLNHDEETDVFFNLFLAFTLHLFD